MDFAPHGATRKSNPNQTAFTQAGHEWWPRFPAPLARNSRFCGRFITPYAVSGHTGFPWGKLINAKLFSDIQFPEGYWFEDSLMRQIVFERVSKAFYINKSVYQYRFNRQSIAHTHQGNPKAIDALYVTLSLWRDKQTLGFSNDKDYQEYLLHMARLIRSRVNGLDETVKRDVFIVFSSWYSSIYGGITPKSDKLLHEAILSGDYGRYVVNLA